MVSACHLACHAVGRGCHLQENSKLHLNALAERHGMGWQHCKSEVQWVWDGV